MEIRFASIHWLWLLPVALTAVWAMGSRLGALSRARRLTVLILRSALFILLILALAGLEFSRIGSQLAVMFVVDDSDSIPPEMREYSRTFYRKAMNEMGPKDLAGVMLFGADASIERNPQPRAEFEEFKSVPSRSQTNIADALRLGMAALPAGAKKRIVLLSDGNETTGDAEEAARAAAASGVALDVVPLSYQFREDVILEKVVVENQVAVDEPFDVKVFVESRRDTQGKLSILRDGTLVATEDVTLHGGRKNVFTLPMQASQPGFHSFTAHIEAPDDGNPENNRAHGFAVAHGEPRVLYVEGATPENNRLVALLRQENIACDLILPDQFPHDPARLQGYNSIVLSNVAASALTQSQMRLVERAVHELGMGLIMTGGENSFGAGGWQDTAVEEALPVAMELKNRKVLPQGALVLNLHTCEIPQGEYWAQEIALASLNVLSERDEFGALAYNWQRGEEWIVPLQQARDKQAIRRTLMNAQNGDMPAFDPTLVMAREALGKSSASVKHIIVISDGDPQPPSQDLVLSMREEGITISTVQIGAHGPWTGPVMEQLALWGGGQFYDVASPQQLPQIFIKEATVVRKSLIYEKAFTPEMKTFSELLVGVGPGEFPDLYGYVGATPKDLSVVPVLADNEDPLLAHWRYGLGKSVAFTSDVYMRWARDWYGWEKMGKLWAQIVRWSLRDAQSQNLQTTTEIENGVGRLVLDAVDDEGRFINFLEMAGSVITPGLESESLAFRQTGPGRYEASFEAAEVGSYIVTAQARGPGGFEDFVTGGASLSYSPEFQTSRSNDALMRKLAEIGRGRVLTEDMRVFDHGLPGGLQPQPVWPLLMALALILLPVDVFFRRVLVDWRMVREGMGTAAAYVGRRLRPASAATQREERMETLLGTKRQSREARTVPAARITSEARQALLKELDEMDVEDVAGEALAAAKPAGAPTRRTEGAESKVPGEPVGAGGFTNKLLEAKRRARR